ncbi:MAG: hypothetical protein AAGA03_20075 [Planctomycetota bacterium]
MASVSKFNDDGLEPNGAEVNSLWHDHLVEDSICGSRMKDAKQRPMDSYHNNRFRRRSPPWCLDHLFDPTLPRYDPGDHRVEQPDASAVEIADSPLRFDLNIAV